MCGCSGTGLVWVALVQAGVVWVTTGAVLGWIKVVEGCDGEEVAMLRLDCVRIEIGLSILVIV